MTQMFQIHQNRYPKAAQFLKDKLPDFHKNVRVWSSFTANSKLSDQEAKDAVVLGVSAPLVFVSNLSPLVYGQFLEEQPNRVELSQALFDEFEKLTVGDVKGEQFLAAKLLHELCHWGRFRKGEPEVQEAGETFEVAAFGSVLDGWWLSPPPAVGAPELTDPAARAILLAALLKSETARAPGATQDPQHKIFTSEDVTRGLPRGYRNNNPGNVIKTNDRWRGLSNQMAMTDFQREESHFAVFREPEWGLRVMVRLLNDYQDRFGLKTFRQIISRWAPASDNNDVDSYAKQVASALGRQPDDAVDTTKETELISVLKAMARHENGDHPPYSEVQFATAILLAKQP